MPGVAQGGYVCGVAARSLDGPCEVRLHRLVRIGTPVESARSGEGVRLEGPEGLIAEATRTVVNPKLPPVPVGLREAEDAAGAYRGFTAHLFPNCYCCGPDREVGEGLRIFPGPVADRSVVAAPWGPHQSLDQGDGLVPKELVWTALDCPAIWAVLLDSAPDSDERALTGRVGLDVKAPIRVGAQYVVLGWPMEREDRRVVAAAGIFSPAGEPQALSVQTCVLTDRGFPLGLRAWGWMHNSSHQG
jgi:hypothetical protein